jgi:hypothetical protein
MKKEELEVILGDGENTPDLGPIEDYLYAVATERKLPDFAVGMCTLRFEEAAPKLRAVLLRAADGEILSDDESLLLFRGLHILGGARDREACQPLLRLLRRPFQELDGLLGKLSLCWACATWCRSSTVPFVKSAYPKNGLIVLSSMRTLPWRNTRPTTSIDSRNTTVTNHAPAGAARRPGNAALPRASRRCDAGRSGASMRGHPGPRFALCGGDFGIRHHRGDLAAHGDRIRASL